MMKPEKAKLLMQGVDIILEYYFILNDDYALLEQGTQAYASAHKQMTELCLIKLKLEEERDLKDYQTRALHDWFVQYHDEVSTHEPVNFVIKDRLEFVERKVEEYQNLATILQCWTHVLQV